MYIQEEIRRE